MQTKVSVILPTLNAANYLPRLLSRLNEQTLPPHEIIVVDSSSDDDSAGLARELGARVITVQRSEFDHGGTRNLAAQAARGDVLVYLTQDALPQHDRFIEAIVEPLSDPQVAAVCGRQVPRPGANVLEKMTRELNYSDQKQQRSIRDLKEKGLRTFFFTDVCSAFRRETFFELGGFPDPIILNEDMIIAAKCITGGYSVVYNPEASVLHSHNYGLIKEFRRNFDIGVSLRMNEWVLRYASAEGAGARLIKEQLRRLWSEGHRLWIPNWFLEAAAKYAGYRLGLGYKSIPVWLRKKLSLHAGFWSNAGKKTGSVATEHNFPAA